MTDATEITPEAADLARRAWDAMLRQPSFFARIFEGAEPMPIGVALDMVQDACSDRDGAQAALEAEARRRVRELFREQVERDAQAIKAMWPRFASGFVDRLHMLGTNLTNLTQILNGDGQVRSWIYHIQSTLAFPDPRDDLLRLERYRVAAIEAHRILDLLSAIAGTPGV
jgi:hypothetical protein